MIFCQEKSSNHGSLNHGDLKIENEKFLISLEFCTGSEWKVLEVFSLSVHSWYLNYFQRCGNRPFTNFTVFQTLLFCLYLRKLIKNFVTYPQKSMLAKF